MRAAFFDLDRGLMGSPLGSAARGLFRRFTGQPPIGANAEFALRLRRQARALIAAHHWRGHVVVLVTDAPTQWANLAAKELDADAVLTGGSAVDSEGAFPSAGPNSGLAFKRVGDNALHPRGGDDSRYPWRSAEITRFCLRYNFAARACFGYGALDDDWLWLETLGHPAVAHPMGKLRRRAQLAGWPILNLNRHSDLMAPPGVGFGSAPPSAPPCVTLT